MSQRNNRNRKDSAGKAAAPQPVTPESLLQEAETLQQRAERKSGRDALQAFEAAAAKYQQALQAGLDPQSQPDAAFGLAECLQLWGDAEVALLQEAPDEALSQQLQQQGQQRAAGLYQSSVQAYQQVVQPAADGAAAGGLRPDAGVNAANALCSWAELVQAPQRAELLQQAVELYRAALAQEEDAATLSNLGDALVAQGEAALQAAQPDAGQAAFAAALECYQASCALSDSSAGDDLPGLLHNWGVGLHAISKQAQDCPLKQSLLQQAADKLRSSIQFSRADAAPHNALGDVLMDAAELVVNLASSNSSCTAAAGGGATASGFGGAVPLPAAAAEQAAALLKQAVDEGYMAALTISRTNADALVGLAEASVAMAKLTKRQGDQAAAAAHINAAVGHYSSALQRPHLLGDASERSDVRYNAACAASLAAQHGTAQQLLAGLAASGSLAAADVAADEDLACLREQPWFGELLRSLQAGSS